MKHIIKLGVNRYLHLDSYGESFVPQRVGQILCAIVVVSMAANTTGALLGVDVSNPSPVPTQYETR